MIKNISNYQPNSLFTLASLIVLSACIVQLIPFKNQMVSAQEHQGCFIVDHSKRVINLDNLCTAQKENKEEKSQVVKGIALSNLALLDQGSSLPLMRGKITNTTNKAINIKQITLQLEDGRTGDVVTTQTPTVTATLAPGQSREFTAVVGKDTDLGGRRASQLTVIFVDWE
jgi:hypothetical protein